MQKNGAGNFVSANGKLKYKGFWSDDVKVKKGTLFYEEASGKKVKETLKDGKLVNDPTAVNSVPPDLPPIKIITE